MHSVLKRSLFFFFYEKSDSMRPGTSGFDKLLNLASNQVPTWRVPLQLWHQKQKHRGAHWEKNKHEDPIVAKLKTVFRNKHGNSLWSSLADFKFDMKLCTPSIRVNPIGMAIPKPRILQGEIGTNIQYKALEQ